MRYRHFIARRYLFSHKQKTVINVISWISMIGVGISATALIVVLSVYNGIGELTQSLFNVFDPQLMVQPVKGKTFHTATIAYDSLCHTQGVKAVSQMVEENAWVTFRQNQAIVQLRGVDSCYSKITGLDTLLYEGTYVLKQPCHAPPKEETPWAVDNTYYLLLGAEVYYQLGLGLHTNTPIQVHIPKRGSSIGYTMEEAFNSQHAYAAGNFYIQQDIDARYVVADIDFVRQLMDYDSDECTSLAIALDADNPRQLYRTQKALRNLLGDDYTVKDRFEQQPVYYKIFRSERFGIILILSLIVVISTLNLVSSLSLLIIDKRKDINTLRSLGMQRADIKKVFFVEGVMIAAIGVVVGLAVGFVVCLLQQQFGIIKMGGGAFVVPAFPVAMRLSDFIGTFLLVLLLSTCSVYFTVRRAKV